MPGSFGRRGKDIKDERKGPKFLLRAQPSAACWLIGASQFTFAHLGQCMFSISVMGPVGFKHGRKMGSPPLSLDAIHEAAGRRPITRFAG